MKTVSKSKLQEAFQIKETPMVLDSKQLQQLIQHKLIRAWAYHQSQSKAYKNTSVV